MNFVLSVIIFFAISSAFAQNLTKPAKDIEPEIVSYKKLPSGKELSIHIFLPSSTPRLAVLFFHGGDWKTGNAEMIYIPCRRMAEEEILTASVQYRLLDNGASSPFDCVEDACDAFKFFEKFLHDRFEKDIPIVLGGGSAGAHLALCAGMGLGGKKDYKPPRVAAFLLYNPVVDTGPDGWESGYKILGGKWRELSPIHHLKSGMPPCLVCHGTADKTVPFENASRFENEYRKLGNICELSVFEGKPHGIWLPSTGTDNFEKCHSESLSFLAGQGLLK